MKVTILTPTLEAETHFGDCLRSVGAQTYPRAQIEHIVLDGLSGDRTVEMARDAGAQVHVGRDGSLYEALNKGVKLATGEWIVWLNADDMLKPDAIERVVASAKAHPSTELIIGDCELLKPDGIQTVRSPRRALDDIRSGARGRAWVIPLVAVYRTRTLRGLGDYATRYRVVGDLDMWLRTAARVPPIVVSHTDSILGTFRVHPGSLSTGGPGEDRNLRETIDLATRWMNDPQAPEGVRDFARFLLRRNVYSLRVREVRELPTWRRKLETVILYMQWRKQGPGVLQDFFTSFH